ncbi:MAG: hypothetical protein COT84_05815 [Chlamydiae bacterium CG10_big_fil_rev_8_21_14_0_10_35_9]|nr:MAG: hypothetical protein COT84_05815 [Chlamydiae bacterium CG10_big_fil_rev_8_21_14_0_10_35_9]
MKFLYLPILILLLSCSNEKLEEPQTYADVAMQIMHETALQLKKEKKLHAYGSGGSMLYCVEMMYLALQVNEDYTFEQKRELVVYALETLLKNVNDNEKIRKDLCQYPFKIENLEIDLLSKKEKDVLSPEGITLLNTITIPQPDM